MTQNNREMPQWIQDDAEIKESKWVGDENILALIRTDNTGTTTLQLASEDEFGMPIDFGGRFNPDIPEDEFQALFDRIDSVEKFYEEQRSVRARIENLLDTPTDNVQ